MGSSILVKSFKMLFLFYLLFYCNGICGEKEEGQWQDPRISLHVARP